MEKLKLGLINIMPNAQQYAESIHRALASERASFELFNIRLKSYQPRSPAAQEPADAAAYFEDLVDRVSLDLLIVTGAPVEHLPFEEVRYWRELREILAYARTNLASVMGICFGGLAIAKFLGIEKRVFPEKHFGVHTATVSPEAARYFGAQCTQVNIPLSTWALLDEDGVSRSRGSIKTLCHHPRLGSLMLCTPDHQYVMMLGHPEYTADTLYQEWERDVAKAIPYTRHYDRNSFIEMERRLQSGARQMLANWVRSHVSSVEHVHA